MKPLPPLAGTGIGSVPFLDTSETMDRIIRDCPLLPYWPQLTKKFEDADMIIQFAKLLPFIESDESGANIRVRTDNMEIALTEFYEHFFSEDFDYFKLPPKTAPGFYDLLDRAANNPQIGPDFLKGQVTGPITFGQAIRKDDGKAIIDHPELVDPAVKVLGANAAWQAAQIRAVGRTPLIIFDEPSLTGFGSAFSNLTRDKVVGLLNMAAQEARNGGEILVGVHICGNTDWEMIFDTNIDLISFDAFSYMEQFLLFPKLLLKFIDDGGYIAWGIVPTINYSGAETAEQLAEMLQSAFDDMVRHGADMDRIQSQSIITPSCGLGPLDPAKAAVISRLTAQTSELLTSRL